MFFGVRYLSFSAVAMNEFNICIRVLFDNVLCAGRMSCQRLYLHEYFVTTESFPSLMHQFVKKCVDLLFAGVWLINA